ncbi:DEAD/DEAH box helicase [Roseomonas marmotae]|uniref:Transcription-repair-coupling factor n=1 Tax=Roseomonas marmotae TaxID=2768161 RepID=A0ABS3K786_9PROT|nr:DEAD/DEAH box helicase [Roseomonas marmotae]MBO1073313.1 DEAD/DEAH box helicase [Roseomonas marmotae]QTI79070.1 DEAD/DEAH box helicase [Roseomonas marmotae]
MDSEPESLLAAQLLEQATEAGEGGLIHLARSEARAARLHRAARALAGPEVEVLLLPGWDCLPYDRASPSRAVMGSRMAVLSSLARAATGPRLVIAGIAAATQRLPPPAAFRSLVLRQGDALDPGKLEQDLLRLGYRLDARVDEPGEAALHGAVLDLYPAAEDGQPCRVEHAEGRITCIRRYDPLTQRSVAEAEAVMLGPASEIIDPGAEVELPLPPGAEHGLADFYPALVSLFELLPKARLVQEVEVEELRAAREREVAEAFRTRLAVLAAEEEAPPLSEPAALYLDAAAWKDAVAGRAVTLLPEAPEEPPGRLPSFSEEGDPEEAFLEFLEDELEAGRRVALAGPPRAARALLRLAEERLGEAATPLPGWLALRAAAARCFARLDGALVAGFRTAGAAVVALADVRPAYAREGGQPSAGLAFGAGQLQPGDAVVHLDHGLGALRGVEAVTIDGISEDRLRLEYADGATKLVPADETDRLWRYGAEAESVTLDRLGGEAWPRRRAEVEAELAETAQALLRLAREREARTAPVLRPPRRAMERFAQGFPYSLTIDQEVAISATLRDLAAGRPMDRLICGDVGFGKTEVAMRAAAAAVLAGYQVALLAPTTVLVRQHLESFRRRFAALGTRIEPLSRLSPAGEARATRAGLASGEIGIAIGTQALAAKGVRFKKLGLVIIDEEQRFGARQKAMLRRLGEGVHSLALTATPIPRTLQSALIGLQALSVIATPPARRQPIRTLQIPASDALLKEALQRERQRGGQSFIVCPRIADIAPMRARLRRLMPRLKLIEAHGDMPPEEIDAAMVRFAEGGADALLSTNIVETGLDVPRANTMLVWHPDRFGLAQLHQLRGRVGRGRVRGHILLLTDPEDPPSAAAARRLKTLEAFDRVGAGFAISARDMDLRGAGDLLGETQAGHVKLIGIGLYQHLLDRALRQARGEPLPEEWSPSLAVGISAGIPEDYIADDALRVETHARLGEILRQGDAGALAELAEEIEDRFGPPPEPVRHWLALARLRLHCRRLGVRRLEAGPQGVAAQLEGERLILRRPSRTPAERLALLTRLLDNTRRHLRKRAA